ncbi:MAG TPA: hypothetical protein VK204_10585 [Nocardioidaceae bacterium]|nr:hypothetical protein [Nocardioidaceae bacterium]
MSTFGTALVIDLAPGSEVSEIAAVLNARVAYPRAIELESGWTRVSAFMPDVGQLDLIKDMSVSAGTCRVAVAEDNDEFGALWAVLSVRDGVVETVHRRYVLNADPTDPGEVEAALQDLDGVDPRAEDVAGPGAARAAADLFEVEQARMLEAELESTWAFEQIGVVGGPFPWWDALRLHWGGVGESLR